MPPGLDTSRAIPTFSGCYKVGTGGFSLAYSVEDQVEFGTLLVVVWDEGTGEIIWQRTYDFVPRRGQVVLEGFVLPSYITSVGFQVTWSGCGVIFTRFNVFVVLDAPKMPMDPAWVSVLRISCQWARGESTPDGAANTLTQRLWDEGEYNGGRLAYTRYICTSPGNRDWNINQNNLNGLPPGKPTGQCNDFADFLVCLITSVGAFDAVAQRTHPLGLGWWFHYKEIDSAGPLPPQEGDWNYHQFCVYGGNVWDGCLAFVAGSPQGVPKKLLRDAVYYNGLIAYYHYGQWLPTPANGFVPIVTSQDLPPYSPLGYQEPACNRGCGGGGPLCTW